VAMVAQQASYILHLTDLCVGVYASSDTVDMFNIDSWMQELKENQVFLITQENAIKTCVDFIMAGFSVIPPGKFWY
jgi:hypothetical protein